MTQTAAAESLRYTVKLPAVLLKHTHLTKPTPSGNITSYGEIAHLLSKFLDLFFLKFPQKVA